MLHYTHMKKYDFVAIGDIVVDDFIKLSDAEEVCDIDHDNCKLCVRFGDKVPYDSHDVVYAVGNSPNAAVSAARLGLDTALSVTVGDDQNGKICIETIEKNGISTELVEVDKELGTNYHYVLSYGPERTILVNHAPYKRTIPEGFEPPKWIYLSSLGENTEAFHHELAAWVKENPETKLAFQPGTFQMKLGTEKLKDIYEISEIFFCNKEEAQRILKTDESDPKKLMDAIHALGPKIVIVTDGIDGAYAREEDGTSWFMPVYPHEPVERTGAGDAFSSTVASCLALGMELKDALMWAPINAMSVTLYTGAQAGLISQEKIKEYLSQAPAEYQVKEI